MVHKYLGVKRKPNWTWSYLPRDKTIPGSHRRRHRKINQRGKVCSLVDSGKIAETSSRYMSMNIAKCLGSINHPVAKVADCNFPMNVSWTDFSSSPSVKAVGGLRFRVLFVRSMPVVLVLPYFLSSLALCFPPVARFPETAPFIHGTFSPSSSSSSSSSRCWF